MFFKQGCNSLTLLLLIRAGLCPFSLNLGGLLTPLTSKVGRSDSKWLVKLSWKRPWNVWLDHWDTCSWSPELWCKKSNYPEAIMLKRPRVGAPVYSPSRSFQPFLSRCQTCEWIYFGSSKSTHAPAKHTRWPQSMAQGAKILPCLEVARIFPHTSIDQNVVIKPPLAETKAVKWGLSSGWTLLSYREKLSLQKKKIFILGKVSSLWHCVCVCVYSSRE